MKCCVHTYKSTELLVLPRYVRIFRNIGKSVYIRSGNRFNSEKSPHPPPGDVGDPVAVFQIVLALIGDHSITKAAPLQRRQIVFFAPHLVNLMGGLQRFGMLLQILCTGFVLLLCLVCMANIHNSLSTGMELRAREYGILRSVGITPVDFRKMIWLESLFYGIKALCWSLPFGMGVLALEYYAIRRAFQLPFCLPVGSIVLAVVLVMGVCWISGLLTRRSLEEQTITEAIQKKLF